MIILPAIDIKNGKVVRLIQGKFDQVTEYANDPVIMAKEWQNKGAEWLHVVDLDGAKTGELQNLSTIIKMAKAVPIPIQVGGGIRRQENISQLLDNGISRIILGTKAVEDKEFFQKVLAQWKEKVAVSVDCYQGKIAQRGWTTTSDIQAVNFAEELEKLGLPWLIYTDISCDGMLQGPHFEGIQELLQKTSLPLIASGGISSIKDIQKLVALKPRAPWGAIIGKALYEKRINLKEALKIAKRQGEQNC